ncbi:MAG: hypothetical protein ACP5HG_07980, partial [Anaerolineae bacterium]
MNKGKIFLVGETMDDLVPMEETDYVREAHLQSLLTRYPDLLPGDQITPENPRRWLLVAREMGVPGDEGETGRWSLDHLFLDQDGVPTFVECKRAADTRARREVVAQMLDYAANGTEYWSMDRLRQAATETAQEHGRDLDLLVADLIGDDEDEAVEAYWEAVEENLQSGRVRLLFVADRTHKELRRLVEFLNEKMTDVEVLAVEIKQYLGEDGRRAVVPRAVGMSETARMAKKASRSRGTTTRSEFLAAVDDEAVPFFDHILDRAIEEGFIINWGTKGFSVRAEMLESGKKVSFAYGWPWSRFDVYFAQLDMVPEAELVELRQRLLALGIFEESGNYTLITPITKETRDGAREAYELTVSTM